MAVKPRLLEQYRDKIVPEFMKLHSLKNINQVPKLEKIVVNVGIKNERASDAKILEGIQDGLGKITGQKPVLKRAKQAISGFKLKKGMPCGCMVTLRKARMYEFLDRLISVAIPRIKDFQGLNDKSFDEAGNYSFGLTEQVIFPEIDVDKAGVVHGMDITIVMNSGSSELSADLLRLFGFPFKRKTKREA
jgi:large subunit ribosomal protein L5